LVLTSLLSVPLFMARGTLGLNSPLARSQTKLAAGPQYLLTRRAPSMADFRAELEAALPALTIWAGRGSKSWAGRGTCLAKGRWIRNTTATNRANRLDASAGCRSLVKDARPLAAAVKWNSAARLSV
jgi:hypothetical protein